MKEKDDVFKKFQDSFGRMEGHFHILEQRIPMGLQMEYFKYSEKIKKEARVLTDAECDAFQEDLSDEKLDMESKKLILSVLGSSRKVKAYRILEDYAKHPSEDVVDWSHMALMESRIMLESELSDEKQIYISTGLGGRDEKLRFYILLTSVGRKPFEEYQRKVIEREFIYSLPQSDCEIERLTIAEQYVELLFLVPIRSDFKRVLDMIINECNQYGNFLSEIFTITNVKELSEEEIQTILNKNGDNQTGH
ncbi:MAG: hypothetical protein RR382_06965 [Tannerellaceae bacterium]